MLYYHSILILLWSWKFLPDEEFWEFSWMKCVEAFRKMEIEMTLVLRIKKRQTWNFWDTCRGERSWRIWHSQDISNATKTEEYIEWPSKWTFVNRSQHRNWKEKALLMAIGGRGEPCSYSTEYFIPIVYHFAKITNDRDN